VLLSYTREYLARIRFDIFKKYICGRKLLARWMCGIVREGRVSKKVIETILEDILKADIEGPLLLIYKLYANSIISIEAIKRYR
jgi:hypothetical protein